LPVVLLDLPSERIAAASVGVSSALGAGDGDIEGRGLEEFLEGAPSGGLELVQHGRLDGYETRRVVRRDAQRQPVSVWIRALGSELPRDSAVAFLIPDADAPHDAVAETDAVAVIGSTDAHLVVDRISSDVEAQFGKASPAAVGRSLFQLVDAGDVAALLSAAAHCAAEGTGASLTAAVRLGPARVDCSIVLLPMPPAPTLAFALLPVAGEAGDGSSATGRMARLLQGFGAGVQGASTSRRAAQAPAVPGLDRLTSRELEVVTRLVQGDRVPTIARSLFLSQSTVRNHLSAAFTKLGVADQQQLVHLFRGR
jgi:DNA-binding CsgD family transcriptional regulator